MFKPFCYDTGDDCMAPDNRGKVMGEFADFTNDSYNHWNEETDDPYDGGWWPKVPISENKEDKKQQNSIKCKCPHCGKNISLNKEE